MPGCTTGLLVVANEPAGPSLPLAERVRRLFPDGAEAVAAFTSDGTLLHANSASQSQLGDAASFPALGIEALAAKALEAGHASGALRRGESDFDVTLLRLGQDETQVLVLTLSRRESNEAPAIEAAAKGKSRTGTEIPITPPTAAVAAPSRADGSEDTEPTDERRHPLRFVWQMDADGRFLVGSDEFVELVGLRTIAACGRLWSEIAAELKLDPGNQVARAVATRDTWSGIPISWPVDDTGERLPVELSALPVFDRDRVFRGYRGFGVCRDIDRLNQLARARQARPIGFMPGPAQPSVDSGEGPTEPRDIAAAPVPAALPQPAEVSEPGEVAPARHSLTAAASDVPTTDNVVPFRAGASPEARAPSLSAVERNAFRELAHELNARLRGTEEEPNRLHDEQEASSEPAASTAIAAAAAHVAADVPAIAPPIAAETQNPAAAAKPPVEDHVLLDRVPAGVLIYRNDLLLYANRRFLELSGYDDIGALAAAGGVSALFAESGTSAQPDSGGAQRLSIVTHHGDKFPVEGRLFTVPWNGASALALILTDAQRHEPERVTQEALDTAHNELRDLKANFDHAARRETQRAAAAKAEFLSKVSHEIRTPLNSMIGFAEVIMAERFGPIGNDRYREYLKDIHAAGTHIVSMLNDLLDLSKIETGQLDLTFANLDLNDLTQQCVGVMQPQANRARIIIRTALAPGLRNVIADERSLRQIVINLLANAIKFTGPGGQVIVSTATADSGEAVLRVRDTGVGMRETDVQAALEPFQQTSASATWGPGGIGLGLPLTKALAEANRGNFSIKSAPNAGTLVEIAFPTGQVTAR